jgi:hypothetical protein
VDFDADWDVDFDWNFCKMRNNSCNAGAEGFGRSSPFRHSQDPAISISDATGSSVTRVDHVLKPTRQSPCKADEAQNQIRSRLRVEPFRLISGFFNFHVKIINFKSSSRRCHHDPCGQFWRIQNDDWWIQIFTYLTFEIIHLLRLISGFFNFHPFDSLVVWRW